ncbi:hypothetical protein OY671_007528, partial [Metschnikowia pulcherrima]
TSHTGHFGHPATHPPQRLHADTAIYRKSRYATYLRDEFTSFIWAVFSSDRSDLRKATGQALERIDHSHPPHKIVYLVKDNGTELPSSEYWQETLNITSEEIPSYTPVLNGTAERTNGIVNLKARAILRDATTNDCLQELLELFALRHAVLIHNSVPNTNGHIPQVALTGRPTTDFKHMPVFGSDVRVKLPNEGEYKERKLQDVSALGIYLGTHAGNSSVHRVWTNFTRPGERMNILTATNLSFNGEHHHMRIAEHQMAIIQQEIAAQTPLDAPIPPRYPNLLLSAPRPKAGTERKSTRVSRPVDCRMDLATTVFAGESRIPSSSTSPSSSPPTAASVRASTNKGPTNADREGVPPTPSTPTAHARPVPVTPTGNAPEYIPQSPAVTQQDSPPDSSSTPRTSESTLTQTESDTSTDSFHSPEVSFTAEPPVAQSEPTGISIATAFPHDDMRDRIRQLEGEVADSNRLINDLGNIQHSQLELSHQQLLDRFSQLQEELSAHQHTTARAVHANAQETVDSVTTNTLKYFNKQLHAYHQAFAQSLADATTRSDQRIDDCLARIQNQQVTDSIQLRDQLRQAFIEDAQDAHNLA